MSQTVLLQDRITHAAEPTGAPQRLRGHLPTVDRRGSQDEPNPARGICVAALAGILCWIGVAAVIF